MALGSKYKRLQGDSIVIMHTSTHFEYALHVHIICIVQALFIDNLCFQEEQRQVEMEKRI